MKMTAVIQYILAAAQSFDFQDYNRMTMILGLADVSFCEKEQTLTKWIIVCSEENNYLDA